MTLKTDYRYNDDDFAQRNGAMQELTVTITLCEYRNLITEITRNEAVIAELIAEKGKLEEKLESTTKALAICKLPEWMRSFGNTLAHWGEEDESEDVRS